ncbi:E3 ubiquitin-protein ligase RING1 [Olea europaea subsp. europaea]|uniref:E3 ubiquitin-protein ligase RING1 n=1 Tax=Olea europaea subsp. europaea TaxID=158383 RepID=A0A8S0TNJ1_OLEEU|nr:E3 ubiquitin-protein ligase RING1 [Olea europaea subsp. europaea]
MSIVKRSLDEGCKLYFCKSAVRVGDLIYGPRFRTQVGATCLRANFAYSLPGKTAHSRRLPWPGAVCNSGPRKGFNGIRRRRTGSLASIVAGPLTCLGPIGRPGCSCGSPGTRERRRARLACDHDDDDDDADADADELRARESNASELPSSDSRPSRLSVFLCFQNKFQRQLRERVGFSIWVVRYQLVGWFVLEALLLVERPVALTSGSCACLCCYRRWAGTRQLLLTANSEFRVVNEPLPSGQSNCEVRAIKLRLARDRSQLRGVLNANDDATRS